MKDIRGRTFEDMSVMHNKQHRKYDTGIDKIVDTV